MPAQGSLLFQAPPHRVDIYLPAASTFDSGGGVKNNWSAVPDAESVDCSINSQGSSGVRRQDREGNTMPFRVAFLTETLTTAGITLIHGTKFITSADDQDPGRTFIFESFASPNRRYGDYVTDIPAFTYCNCVELK